MYMYMYIYIHTYTYLSRYTHFSIYVLMCFIHTYIPTYLHTYIPTYLHACFVGPLLVKAFKASLPSCTTSCKAPGLAPHPELSDTKRSGLIHFDPFCVCECCFGILASLCLHRASFYHVAPIHDYVTEDAVLSMGLRTGHAAKQTSALLGQSNVPSDRRCCGTLQ